MNTTKNKPLKQYAYKKSIEKTLLNILELSTFKERTEIFEKIEDFLIENKTNILRADYVPLLPKPDKTGKSYTLYKPVKQDIHPYDFLKNHHLWPKMLKHFSPSLERDHLFQDQLKALDECLYISLKRKYQSMKKNMGFNIFDIIPPKSVRISNEIELTNMTSQKKISKIINTVRKRQQRQKKD